MTARIEKSVKKLDDTLSMQTAKGFSATDKNFAKLNEKLDNLDGRLSVKDGKLENTVERVDQHEKEIQSVKRKLKFA